MSYPQEDKPVNPPGKAASDELKPPSAEPLTEPVQTPPISEIATAAPAAPPAPQPPHPWIKAKKDLTSRFIYYVLFNLSVYGFYLFAEAHGYWPFFFVFVTAVAFAIEYKIKAKRYKNAPCLRRQP